MKPPSKRDFAYDMIARSIRNGRYAQGAYLPGENALAADCGVARETLRSALVMLEHAGFIERLRGRGTRVCMTALPPLTYLTACPDFFGLNGRSPAVLKARRQLAGISKVVFDAARRLETIPLSPTNNPDDIDFRSLAHLNEKSCIVMNGTWGRRVFHFLAERGCRVAVEAGEFEMRVVESFQDRFLVMLEDNRRLMADAVAFFANTGARRIALAYWGNLLLPGHPMLDGFLTCVRERGLPDDLFGAFSCRRRAEVRQEIGDFYQRCGFDALILAPLLEEPPRFDVPFHENYGLPKSVRLLTLLDSEDNVTAYPPISSFDYEPEVIGAEMAKRLLADVWVPGVVRCRAALIDRTEVIHTI